jgi:hypothetical protein
MDKKHVELTDEQDRIVGEYRLNGHGVMVEFVSNWVDEQPDHKLHLDELDYWIERSVLDILAERLMWDVTFAEFSETDRLSIVDQVADSLNWPVAQRIIDAEVEERLAKAENV